MIPLDKGEVPIDSISGLPQTVTDYAQWRASLINRLGSYCSYCNAPLSSSPQVEHVVPKNPQPGQVAGSLLGWENMLLACGPCNNAKNNNPISTNTHYLPETCNPLFIFDNFLFEEGQAIIKPNQTLSPLQNIKAVNTISLLMLDDIDRRTTVIVDLRSSFRSKAIKSYSDLKSLFHLNNHPQKAKIVAALSESIGFFSIAFEVFKDEPDVLIALRDTIPGFNRKAVDDNGNLVYLNPENQADPF